MQPTNLSARISLLPLLLVVCSQGVLGAEVESGYFKAASTGSFSENLGFRPDYIELYSQQKTENLNFEEDNVAENRNCPQDVNGWSEGAVLFDSNGVKKQFTVGAARNSDSTNDHRVASSTSKAIKMPYSGRNGGKCGELRLSVSGIDSNGFEYEIESRYQFDEVVRYKAYQFPDNMEFDAGMRKVTGQGGLNVDTGFRPANIHVRAAQQIDSKNVDKQFEDNDPESDNTLGRSKGYATLDIDGGVIGQQSIGTASSSDSTNAHRSIASDDYILNTAYVGQDGNLFGRLRAEVTGSSPSGFSLNVDRKWSGTDDIFLYRAWGFSFYEYEIGYNVVGSEGSKSFDTGFEPQAIDLYSEQQIGNIDQEVVTDTNSGCDNAGGWSYGYYDTTDSQQGSLSTGRSSDSQNAHRYGASDQYAINNLYSGQSGQDCGNFQGRVTQTSDTGFTLDFSFDNDFESNYGEELFYYRALEFQTAKPIVRVMNFTNSSQEHSFTLNATIRQGSNNIDLCKFNATTVGTSVTRSVDAKTINDSWSRCAADFSYDDASAWESAHDNNDKLLTSEVLLNATDSEGVHETAIRSNTFPNHKPTVKSFNYSEIGPKYAFNSSVIINDTDDGESELDSCRIEISDPDTGTSFQVAGEVYSIASSGDLYGCNYSNINSTYRTSFRPTEDVELDVTVEDVHDSSSSDSNRTPIPNTEPRLSGVQPANQTTATESPIAVSANGNDPEGDATALYIINATGDDDNVLSKTTAAGFSYSGSYDWADVRIREPTYWYVNLSDPYTNYTSPIFSFRKVTSSLFRAEIEIPERYRTISTTRGAKKSITFTVDNPSARDKELEISLHNINSTIEQSGSPRLTTTIGSGDEKTFQATLEPRTTDDRELIINATNRDALLDNKKGIPVEIKNPVATDGPSSRQVPGITAVNLFVVASAGLAFFFWFS